MNCQNVILTIVCARSIQLYKNTFCEFWFDKIYFDTFDWKKNIFSCEISSDWKKWGKKIRFGVVNFGFDSCILPLYLSTWVIFLLVLNTHSPTVLFEHTTFISKTFEKYKKVIWKYSYFFLLVYRFLNDFPVWTCSRIPLSYKKQLKSTIK